MQCKISSIYGGGYKLECDQGSTFYYNNSIDYPSLAALFGYNPCTCGYTDGTVKCEHKTVSQMIGEAIVFIYELEGFWIEATIGVYDLL